MLQTCQHCATVYTPRRKGGRFCSTNCRVSAWDKAQKSEEAHWLYQGDEYYLAHKLDFLGEEAGKLLSLLEGYPTTEQLTQIKELLGRMWGERDNSVVQRVIRQKVVVPGGTSVNR
ncbi:hypothetical protein ABIB60_004529 [Hymenobacter sp. UYP22]